MPLPNLERRSLAHAAGAGLSLTEPTAGNELPTVVGYAAVYDAPSEILVEDGSRLREVYRRGCFDKALAELRKPLDARALDEHIEYRILGRTRNGTLRLVADEVGLRFEIDLPATTIGRDCVESLRRGDRDASSLGFFPVANGERWSRSEDGLDLRELLDLDIAEVSLVTWPAYPDATAALRSLAAARGAATAETTTPTPPAGFFTDLDSLRLAIEFDQLDG